MPAKREALVALGMIAFGSWVLWEGSAYRVAALTDPVGPALFPMGIGLGIALLGGVHLVSTLARRGRAQPENAEPEAGDKALSDPGARLRVSLLAAICAAYVGTLESIGYLLGTLAFLAAVLWVLEVRDLPRLLATSVGLSAALYLVFSQLLRVPLPAWLQGL